MGEERSREGVVRAMGCSPLAFLRRVGPEHSAPVRAETTPSGRSNQGVPLSYQCRACLASRADSPKQVKVKYGVCKGCRMLGLDAGGPVVADGVVAQGRGRITLDGTIQQTLSVLAEQSRRIASQLDVESAYNPALSTEAANVARAIAVVSKEARAVEGMESSEAEELGFDDRLLVVVDWLDSLSPEQRRVVLARVTERMRTLAGEAAH